MRAFQEAFKAYGLDDIQTMNRFAHNEPLCLNLLPMLFVDNGLCLPGEALNLKNWTAAFKAAHSLKGVVGNLEPPPLYPPVCSIAGPLSKLYQAVCEEFEKAEEFKNLLKEGNPA